MRLIVQWLVGILAIAVAVRIVPGISIRGDELRGLVISAVILGLVNLLVRPLLTLLTLPLTIITLGLFWFVIGAVVLVLTSWLSVNLFGAGIVIDGFLSAILGGLVIAIVSAVVGFLLNRA